MDGSVPRILRSAISAFTRVFDRLCGTLLSRGSSRVPAQRCIVKNAIPRPRYETCRRKAHLCIPLKKRVSGRLMDTRVKPAYESCAKMMSETIRERNLSLTQFPYKYQHV